MYNKNYWIWKNNAIKRIVNKHIDAYVRNFTYRHINQIDDPDGTLNMKIHNVFISSLNPEIQYYTALVRSFDSSLGNMIERMAIDIARLSYKVNKSVHGPLGVEQTRFIADLLEKYKTRQMKPSVQDYQNLRNISSDKSYSKRHDSDYYLIDRHGNHYLIELKIGGDLDNKKSRSEKEAILEQYAILSNTLPKDTDIKIFFATAYNRYGEENKWDQQRVRQFFAEDELLIGRDFWNFICRSNRGYEIVLNAYQDKTYLIRKSLDNIKNLYLGRKEIIEQKPIQIQNYQ